MKSTIQKRIRQTENVIKDKRITQAKRNRFTAKLTYLKSLLIKEIKDNVKIRFTRIKGYQREK